MTLGARTPDWSTRVEITVLYCHAKTRRAQLMALRACGVGVQHTSGIVASHKGACYCLLCGAKRAALKTSVI